MGMKIITYDLNDATNADRRAFDEKIAKMGFKRILRTVWIGDSQRSCAEIVGVMDLRDGDKALVAELDDGRAYKEFGLEVPKKPGRVDTAWIYHRLNNLRTGRVKDLLSLRT